MPSKKEDYFSVLTAAVNDLAEHGYDSAERIRYWTERLRKAAEAGSTAPPIMDRMLREQLVSIYKSMIENGGVSRYHGKIDRFTLQRLSPALHAELDRRILASANLVKLNRDQAIAQTLHRFTGWATSVPAGGSEALRRAKTKAAVRKPLASLPFVERRVLIDQGHKLTSALNDIIAQDGGAIAAVWHSHWRQSNYDYRPDHKARDGKVYLIRNSWAQAKGLIKVGPDGYLDEITQAAEEPFCRCYVSYIYAVGELPHTMITKKGLDALRKVA